MAWVSSSRRRSGAGNLLRGGRLPAPRLLARLAEIKRMERGKTCRMAGRRHYSHQTWQDGRNVARYFPASEAASLEEAIAGYRLFMKLAQEYAAEVIRRTRAERAQNRTKQMVARKKRE